MSIASSIVDDNNHTRIPINILNQLPTVSRICLPFGSEYQPQERVPPIGPEARQPFILTTIEENENTGKQQKRFSIITEVSQSIDDDNEKTEDQNNRGKN